jgi:hypothetical protein
LWRSRFFSLLEASMLRADGRKRPLRHPLSRNVSTARRPFPSKRADAPIALLKLRRSWEARSSSSIEHAARRRPDRVEVQRAEDRQPERTEGLAVGRRELVEGIGDEIGRGRARYRQVEAIGGEVHVLREVSLPCGDHFGHEMEPLRPKQA